MKKIIALVSMVFICGNTVLAQSNLLSQFVVKADSLPKTINVLLGGLTNWQRPILPAIRQ